MRGINYVYPAAEDAKIINKCFKAKLITGKNIFEELEDRGYDLSTFKFEIIKKKEEKS